VEGGGSDDRRTLLRCQAAKAFASRPRFQRKVSQKFKNSVDMFSALRVKPVLHFVNRREYDREQNENE
jgi:hypothetical protein